MTGWVYKLQMETTFLSSSSGSVIEDSQWLSIYKKRKGFFSDKKGKGRSIKRGSSDGTHLMEETQFTNIGLMAKSMNYKLECLWAWEPMGHLNPLQSCEEGSSRNPVLIGDTSQGL